MKKLSKITIRLAVALCTFGAGFAAFEVISYVRGPAPLNSSSAPVNLDLGCQGTKYSDALKTLNQPHAVEYCEIANQPQCYSGKLLLMRASLMVDDHGMYFFGPSCEIKRTAGQLTGMSSDEYEEAWREACGRQCSTPLEVVVLGRFELVVPSRATDLNWDNMSMHFKLLRIGEAHQSR
jgi:hypothetical protein